MLAAAWQTFSRNQKSSAKAFQVLLVAGQVAQATLGAPA